MALRWALAVLIGLTSAALIGVLAWLFSPDSSAISGIVFAAFALPVGLLLGWIIAVAPMTHPRSQNAEESVEEGWLTEAQAGASRDTLIVAGIGLAAVSITEVEIPTQLVLLVIVLLIFASTAIRYSGARVRATRP